MARAIGIIQDVIQTDDQGMIARVHNIETPSAYWYGRLIVNQGGMVTCMSDPTLQDLGDAARGMSIPQTGHLPPELAQPSAEEPGEKATAAAPQPQEAAAQEQPGREQAEEKPPEAPAAPAEAEEPEPATPAQARARGGRSRARS